MRLVYFLIGGWAKWSQTPLQPVKHYGWLTFPDAVTHSRYRKVLGAFQSIRFVWQVMIYPRKNEIQKDCITRTAPVLPENSDPIRFVDSATVSETLSLHERSFSFLYTSHYRAAYPQKIVSTIRTRDNTTCVKKPGCVCAHGKNRLVITCRPYPDKKNKNEKKNCFLTG